MTFNNSDTALRSYDLYLPVHSVIIGLFIIMVVVVSIVANSIVLLTLLARRKRMKETDWFIMALAISDISLSLLLHPMIIATSFGADANKLFTTTGCNIYGFGAIFFGCLDMMIHGMAALSRYLMVINSKAGKSHKKLNFSLLSFVVVLAFGFAIAPIFGWGRYETFEFGCTVAFHDNNIQIRTYVISLLVTVFFIPLAACIFFYSRIWYLSYQCKKELINVKKRASDETNSSQKSENKPTTAIQSKPNDDTNDEIQQAVEVQPDSSTASKGDEPKPAKRSVKVFSIAKESINRKLAKLTLTMAIGFITAWTPFATLSIVETFYPPTQIPTAFRYTASLFCKSATAYNPFIYFFLSKGFRQDFIEVIYRMCFGNSDFDSFRSSDVRSSGSGVGCRSKQQTTGSSSAGMNGIRHEVSCSSCRQKTSSAANTNF